MMRGVVTKLVQSTYSAPYENLTIDARDKNKITISYQDKEIILNEISFYELQRLASIISSN